MAETIDGLKERRAWLLKQVELTDRAIEKLLQRSARPPRQTPQELPGLPPPPLRAMSVHEENYAEFQKTRRAVFERIGVAFVDDEPNPPAFINMAMKRIREACASDEELFRLFDAFCSEQWGARCTPPYPFRALASDKIWKRVLTELHGFKPILGVVQ